jgi:hypothetical protein
VTGEYGSRSAASALREQVVLLNEAGALSGVPLPSRRHSRPQPSEVANFRRVAWDEYVRDARSPTSDLSPSSKLQVKELVADGQVQQFLSRTTSAPGAGNKRREA